MSVGGWLERVLVVDELVGGRSVVAVDWPDSPVFELRVHLPLPAPDPATATSLTVAVGAELEYRGRLLPDVRATASLAPTGLLVEACGAPASLPAVLDVLGSVLCGGVPDDALERGARTFRDRAAMLAVHAVSLDARLLSWVDPALGSAAVPSLADDADVVGRARALLESAVGRPGGCGVLIADGASAHADGLRAVVAPSPGGPGATTSRPGRDPAGRAHTSAGSPAVTPGRTLIGLVSGTVSRSDEDHPAVEVAHHILGGHTHSRLSRGLRERHALASTPEGPLRNAGTVSFSLWRLEVAAGDGRDVLRTLDEVVAGLATDGPGRAELRRAVRELTVHDLVAAHTPAGLATTLLAYLIRGLRPADLTARPARLAQLSTDDVRSAAARHLAPDVVRCIAVSETGLREGRLSDVVRAAVPARAGAQT